MPRKAARGQGSVTRRTTKAGTVYYQASVMLGKKDDGTPLRLTATGKTQKMATERLAEKRRLHEDGRIVAPERGQTLGQFVELWLISVARPTVRPRVYIYYDHLLRHHVLPKLGNRKIAALTPQEVQLHYSVLLKSLSPQTVRHVHRLLHRALRDAARWELISRNVCTLVDPPKVAQKEMRTYDAAQARQLLQFARQDDYEAVYVMALLTGMRLGEILGLKWPDILADTVHVQRTLARIPKVGWVLQEPKTAAGKRHIPLLPRVKEALRRHRTQQKEWRLAAGADWEEGGVSRDLIFTTRKGQPLHVKSFHVASFLPLLERAGLPRLRFHDLRHSCATLLHASGADLKVIGAILGHANIAITADIYTHAVPALAHDALARVDTLLADGP